MGSGHVDTAKILAIAEETGGYTIPLHEFMRAVIYGDHELDPSSSVLPNVFDVSRMTVGSIPTLGASRAHSTGRRLRQRPRVRAC